MGTSHAEATLKGQCHEIFEFRFLPESVSPQPQSIPLGVRTDLIFFENSRRYSQLKLTMPVVYCTVAFCPNAGQLLIYKTARGNTKTIEFRALLFSRSLRMCLVANCPSVAVVLSKHSYVFPFMSAHLSPSCLPIPQVWTESQNIRLVWN
jgi:hypothetical protein